MERKQLGLLFMILSCAPYAALFAIPFTSLNASESAVAATVLIVTGESLFAIGGLLAGRSLMERLRRKIIPQRLQRREGPTGSEE
ncbi:transporter suffix domain-containing protein [Candidatus Poseidonia alphae]|nr:transporter suffix domain-containing protein [Candidatus Poseidonia alphae]